MLIKTLQDNVMGICFVVVDFFFPVHTNPLFPGKGQQFPGGRVGRMTSSLLFSRGGTCHLRSLVKEGYCDQP